MTFVIFALQFKALWAAVGAFLISAMTYYASASRSLSKLSIYGLGLTTAFLIYLTFNFLPGLPQL